MSDVQPPRATSIVAVADDVIGALKASPVILLIVLLNCAFAGAASYFMVRLETFRHEAMVTLLDRCIPKQPPP